MQFGQRDVFRFDGQLSGVYCLLGKVVLQEVVKILWQTSVAVCHWPRFLKLDYCSDQDQIVATVKGRFHFDECCADEGRLRFDE